MIIKACADMLNIKMITVLLMLLVINGCYSSQKRFETLFTVMGTSMQIIIYLDRDDNCDDNKKRANAVLSRATEIAIEFSSRYSVRNEGSVISILNQAGKMKIEDGHFLDLIKKSLIYAELTNGAFDPSLYNLIKLWEFNRPDFEFPTRDVVEVALHSSGFKNVSLENNRIILKNKARLHLGGIAKGAIISEVARFIESQGIQHFLVNGGGDIVAKGHPYGKKQWNIAITDPYKKTDYIGTVELTDMAIVTSGDYERFIVKDGIRYHHIVDPATGYPVRNNLTSVTVVGKDIIEADAFATAFFVMGREKAIPMAKSNGLEVIFIENSRDNMLITATDGISIVKNGEMYNFRGFPKK